MNNETNKKLLYFCSSGVFGGAERFVETCLRAHREIKDYEAQALFLNSGDFTKYCEKEGFITSISPFKVKLSNVFSWIRFQFYFYCFLKKRKIDIVHFTMPYSQFFGSLAAKLAGCKIVWFQHGPIGGPLDRLANLFPYDLLLFNSNFTKQEHLNKAGKIKSISEIIPLKVSTSFDYDESKMIRDKYKKSGPLFISSGRICRWKGIEVAIEAIKLLNDKKKCNAKLIILGKPSTEDDQEYLAELKKLTEDFNLGDNVDFLGFKENVYDYIHAADSLLHTSTTPEPFGLVIAEAISLNTFVFATESGGAKDQLKNSENNGVVYFGDKLNEALYGAIEDQFDLILSLSKGWGRQKNPQEKPSESQVFEMMSTLRKTIKKI